MQLLLTVLCPGAAGLFPQFPGVCSRLLIQLEQVETTMRRRDLPPTRLLLTLLPRLLEADSVETCDPAEEFELGPEFPAASAAGLHHGMLFCPISSHFLHPHPLARSPISVCKFLGFAAPSARLKICQNAGPYCHCIIQCLRPRVHGQSVPAAGGRLRRQQPAVSVLGLRVSVWLAGGYDRVCGIELILQHRQLTVAVFKNAIC